MKGMSKIVRTIACILIVPGIMFGLYVIIHGHLTPGGGFQGGAIIATISALFIIAYGEKIRGVLNQDILSLAEGLALLAFISLAFLGLSVTFFHNFLANEGFIFGKAIGFGINPGYLNTGGVIPLLNLAVGLEVFSALSLIVLVMYLSSKKEVLKDVN
ncbi:MAG: hypothetical protein KAU03_05595 [Candidatus Altiarchaeales archaeon]|nr:hypothetical protein [Candidatus Altiarchaeales archaeon]